MGGVVEDDGACAGIERVAASSEGGQDDVVAFGALHAPERRAAARARLPAVEVGKGPPAAFAQHRSRHVAHAAARRPKRLQDGVLRQAERFAWGAAGTVRACLRAGMCTMICGLHGTERYRIGLAARRIRSHRESLPISPWVPSGLRPAARCRAFGLRAVEGRAVPACELHAGGADRLVVLGALVLVIREQFKSGIARSAKLGFASSRSVVAASSRRLVHGRCGRKDPRKRAALPRVSMAHPRGKSHRPFPWTCGIRPRGREGDGCKLGPSARVWGQRLGQLEEARPVDWIGRTPE